MYVGAWQEYKLMKVIEDLRDENEKLRHVIDTSGGGSGAGPLAESGEGLDTVSLGFSSSVPTRAALPTASPRRPSTTEGGPFEHYPSGHPLATSYRAIRQEPLPSPALTSEEQARQQQRLHHRGSGGTAPTTRAGSATGVTRPPFRMYWRPDAYGHYSVDNFDGASAVLSYETGNRSSSPPRASVHGSSGRHCASCARKQEVIQEGRHPSGPVASTSTTADVMATWRQRDPSVWTSTPSASTSYTQAPSQQQQHEQQQRSITTRTAITDMAPPRYSPREDAILASMGLTQRDDHTSASDPLRPAQRRVMDSAATAPGTSTRLLAHPLVHDLARRLPLDTASLGQLAGQKVYTRCVKGENGTTTSTADNCVAPRPSAKSAPKDVASAQQVERRLRLQALYSGMAPGDVEAYLRAQHQQQQQPPQQSPPTESLGGATKVIDETDARAEARADEDSARGVPWDALPGPTVRPPTEQSWPTGEPRDVRTELPTTTVASLDELLGGAAPGLLVPPPPRQEIDEGDIGGLLEWAENLDLDLIDNM